MNIKEHTGFLHCTNETGERRRQKRKCSSATLNTGKEINHHPPAKHFTVGDGQPARQDDTVLENTSDQNQVEPTENIIYPVYVATVLFFYINYTIYYNNQR